MALQAPFFATLTPGDAPGHHRLDLRWEDRAEAVFRMEAAGAQVNFGDLTPIEPEGGVTLLGLDLRGRDHDRIVEVALAWTHQVRPGESVQVSCGGWSSAPVSAPGLANAVGAAAARAPCDADEGLAGWATRPAARRVWLSVDPPPPPALAPGPAHLVNLGGPTPDAWRALARATGGRTIQVGAGEHASLAELRRGEARAAQVDLVACGAGTIRIHREGPVGGTVDVQVSSPPCAVVPAPSASMAGWLVPALGLGGALTAGGLAWWASRTTFGPRAASPTESTPTTPNAASASGWRLRYVRGEGAGTVLPWPGVTLTLGAGAGNDVVLSGPGISGRHARLERFGSGAVFVTDNDSANGTWVDGDRLELGERRLLRPGQRLSLGQDLELELLGPETPP